MSAAHRTGTSLPWTEASWRRIRAGYLVIALVAGAVYLPGSRWGVPHASAPNRTHAWGVDDETPLGTLSEVWSIRRDVPDRNLGYPLMYAFLTTAACAPYIGIALLNGSLSSPGPDYPYGFADPVAAIATLGTIAHVVTALMAVLAVLAVWDAARIGLGSRAAPFAAPFAMLAFPMAYYARTGNVDIPMLSFLMLAHAAFVRCIVLGITTRRCIALGVAVGFALATKEAALGAFLIMPFVLMNMRRHERHDDGAMPARDAWRPLVIGLGAAVIALGVGSGMFVDPGRYLAHIRFLGGRLDTLTTNDVTPVETFAYTWSDSIVFVRVLIRDIAAIMSAPGLIAAVAGSILLARRRNGLVQVLPAIAYVVWMFMTLRAAQLRYMLPAAFLLAPAQAALFVSLIGSSRRAVRLTGVGFATVVLGILGLRTLDLTEAMIHDTRYDAGRWIAEHIQRGESIDYFGADQKLPPIPTGVTTMTAAPYRGMYAADDTSDAAIATILSGWERRAPRFVLAVPDHTNPGASHSRSFPPRLFDLLVSGDGPYVLAAIFEHDRLFPWLPMPPLDYPTVSPPIRIFEHR